MFDPHGIGPRSESFYSRNKGRVLQRKLVDPPSPVVTSYDLDKYYKILFHNGRIPQPSIQNISTANNPYTFQNATFLATGSTISFTGSSAILIDRFQFENGDGIYYTQQDLQYTSTSHNVSLDSGYHSFFSIQPLSNSYYISFYWRVVSDSSTWVVPANSYYFHISWDSDSTKGQTLSFGDTNNSALFSLVDDNNSVSPATRCFLYTIHFQISLPTVSS